MSKNCQNSWPITCTKLFTFFLNSDILTLHVGICRSLLCSLSFSEYSTTIQKNNVSNFCKKKKRKGSKYRINSFYCTYILVNNPAIDIEELTSEKPNFNCRGFKYIKEAYCH